MSSFQAHELHGWRSGVLRDLLFDVDQQRNKKLRRISGLRFLRAKIDWCSRDRAMADGCHRWETVPMDVEGRVRRRRGRHEYKLKESVLAAVVLLGTMAIGIIIALLVYLLGHVLAPRVHMGSVLVLRALVRNASGLNDAGARHRGRGACRHRDGWSLAAAPGQLRYGTKNYGTWRTSTPSCRKSRPRWPSRCLESTPSPRGCLPDFTWLFSRALQFKLPPIRRESSCPLQRAPVLPACPPAKSGLRTTTGNPRRRREAASHSHAVAVQRLPPTQQSKPCPMKSPGHAAPPPARGKSRTSTTSPT